MIKTNIGKSGTQIQKIRLYRISALYSQPNQMFASRFQTEFMFRKSFNSMKYDKIIRNAFHEKKLSLLTAIGLFGAVSFNITFNYCKNVTVCSANNVNEEQKILDQAEKINQKILEETKILEENKHNEIKRKMYDEELNELNKKLKDCEDVKIIDAISAKDRANLIALRGVEKEKIKKEIALLGEYNGQCVHSQKIAKSVADMTHYGGRHYYYECALCGEYLEER